MTAADPQSHAAQDDPRRRPAMTLVTPHHPKVIVDSSFSVTRGECEFRFADGIEPLCRRVRELVERSFAARGLRARHATVERGRCSQATLVASQGERLVGTLTVGIDSAAGLLADALYRAELDAARRRGARVCELTRLAIDPALGSPQVMATLFHLGFMVARFIHGMTDLFVEVHPRHTGFYRRMLGHRVAGPQRTCPRVDAPAVLMRLPMRYAERQIHRHGGSGRADRHSLYPLFFSPAEQEALLRRMCRAKAA